VDLRKATGRAKLKEPNSQGNSMHSIGVRISAALNEGIQTNEFIELKPVKSYVDAQALAQFSVCLNSFSKNDATGNSYCIWRDGDADLKMSRLNRWSSQHIADELTHGSSLDKYEMLVIDSGNSHGDAWIATFYPKQCVMTYVDQMALYEGAGENCISCGGSADAGFRGGQCSACASHSEVNTAKA
jgi:hypothetical protein